MWQKCASEGNLGVARPTKHERGESWNRFGLCSACRRRISERVSHMFFFRLFRASAFVEKIPECTERFCQCTGRYRALTFAANLHPPPRDHMGRAECVVRAYGALCAECGPAGTAFNLSSGDGPVPWTYTASDRLCPGATTKRTVETFIQIFGDVGLTRDSNRPSNPLHTAGQKLHLNAARIKTYLERNPDVVQLHSQVSIHSWRLGVQRGSQFVHAADGPCEACKIFCPQIYAVLNPAVPTGGKPPGKKRTVLGEPCNACLCMCLYVSRPVSLFGKVLMCAMVRAKLSFSIPPSNLTPAFPAVSTAGSRQNGAPNIDTGTAPHTQRPAQACGAQEAARPVPASAKTPSPTSANPNGMLFPARSCKHMNILYVLEHRHPCYL